MENPLILTSDRTSGLDEQTVAHLQELQRFAEIGRLSASLLHEISNPLTAAILHLDPACAGTPQNLRHARRNIQVLQRYVEAARQQVKHASHPRLFSVRSQLEQVRRILEPHARRHNVALRFRITTSQRLFGDAVKFQQAVANLVKNAIDSYATLPGQHQNRTVLVDATLDGQTIVLTVMDHGLGMSPEELSKIFEPFYTTKVRAGHGLGIGLTIVKQFIDHDFAGTISAQSTFGKGTTFTLRLPLRDKTTGLA
ncbi:MAG: two-component sensor histidine kinase [Candidatus Saccharibacteria bacterium]|nr:two-component sensor histidine kinase [Candidatus Saccharibacteria bacterium]